ncbi:hypothetical protein Tco_1213956 [Tanacetum coccineum]
MVVDEGSESSDAYCSSDEEDLSFVDFHTEGRCARYNTIKREKELFSTKSDDKEQKQGRKKSFKVNKVTTRSRAKTSEDTSKSPQTTCKSPMKAGNSGEGCSKSPKHWMVILSDFQEPDVRNGHEAYGVNIHLKTQVDGGRGQRRGRGGRGEWSGGSGESNAAMGEGSDGMGQRAGGRAQRGREALRYTLEVEARYEREDEERLKEQIKEEEWDRKHNYFHPSNWTHKESSVVANLSDMGEIGFRLGDFEAEDNHMSIVDGNADLGITCAQPIASVSPSVDKGKQVAEPSEEASPKPQAKKKGSKRKASSASEELPLRIIYHKNRGRSRRVNTK